MAFQDFMNQAMGFGNDAFMTEEERRRREEAEKNPVKQTIITNPVTGEQTMKIEGSVEDLSPKNPYTPTVSGPVAPSDTYQRMIQAESRGQDFTPSGAPLTSPKGAMFAGQVMPSTAANPGFGVTPAQAQTPEEYNRVGRDYYQALLQKYNGDERLAAAAYNMGPGAVDRNIQQNQGQFNVATAPQETQGYLQKVLGGALNAMVPSAQAAPAPTAPVAPTPVQPARITQPGQYVNLGASQGPSVPYQAPAPVPNQLPAGEQVPGTEFGPPKTAMTPAGVAQRFMDAQKSPDQLAIIAADNAEDPSVRQLARDMYFKQESQYRQLEEAKVKLADAFKNNDFNTVARDMRRGGDMGDWFKYIFFKSNGFTEAADNVADKLGLNDTWAPSMLGNQQVAAKYNKSGEAVEGRYITGPNAGKTLSQDELQLIYGQSAGAAGNKPDYVGGSVVNDKTGQIGRIVSRGGRTMIESGGALFAPTTDWRQNTVGTDLKLAANKALIDLEGKSTTEQLGWIKKWNAEHPDARIPEDVSGVAMLRQWAGTGTPAATTTAPTAVPGAPTAVPGAPTTTTTPAANPTVEKAKEIGRQEIVKKSADIVATSADIITKVQSYDKALGQLERQETNFGGLFNEGIIPGERQVGKLIGSQDWKNTESIMRDIKGIQSSAAKMLGVNPTDRDLQFVVDNSPDESWTNEAISEYIRKYRDAAYRTLDIANKQVESGGRYQPQVPAQPPTSGGQGGIKILKREKI